MADAVHDVIVIGLGAMGSACLRALAQAGLSVVGIDRHAPPHAHGSTHGETRATRLGVGEGDVYVPLVQRSHAVWRELEAAYGDPLLVQCGFLTIDTSGGAGELHGMGGFLDRTIAVARRAGICHEALGGGAIRDRFPAFAPPDTARGYYEPEGGFVFVERAVSALLADARHAGAAIRTGEAMLSFEATTDAVTVRTDRATYAAHTLVLTAGPWLPALVPALRQHVRLFPQALHWLTPARREAFDPAFCPVYLWLHGSGPEDLFYGFPQVGASGQIKVATEQSSQEDASADPSAPGELTASEALIARHLSGRLTATLRPVRAAGCRYAVTPDGHFIVDRLSDAERVIAVSACSGHGFKHAPAIGEMVAGMIRDHAPAMPDFALDRPALHRPQPHGTILS
ncbi:N-methyl-L-tryptophan oxidase [Erythrobacter sp. BLCC-B19]|uniref:N-methyl-L-tryptophan oxidase n=1 Tax=Erythrobacter sp. BLCC-B19 TaxID=3025315 RepID=UPI002362A999|nr:N-methyl-L-tryptophan oxidase [Erythrobacter sp. BLCC-B19]WDA41405.1 N-methyl-L-tryptophan oxidase [Erythrobacter sp. BLCC-B19]